MAAEFGSLAWCRWGCGDELDMGVGSHRLLGDGGVQLGTIRQARMMADRLVD